MVKGKVIIAGKAEGPALVTNQPINILAAYGKNLILPWKTGKISDKEHELHRKDLRETILFTPFSIGSTTGGVILLEAIRKGIAPKGMVVAKADILLVSGSILASAWLDQALLPPIVECPEIFGHVQSGHKVKIDGENIEVENY